MGKHTKEDFIEKSEQLNIPNVENFIKNGHKKYTGKFKDVGVLNFLEKNKDCFFVLPEDGYNGPYPTPEAWSGFIDKAYSDVALQGDFSGALEAVRNDAIFFLGREVADKYMEHYKETFNIQAKIEMPSNDYLRGFEEGSSGQNKELVETVRKMKKRLAQAEQKKMPKKDK